MPTHLFVLSTNAVVCFAHIIHLNRCFAGWAQVGPTSGWLGGSAFSGLSCHLPQTLACKLSQLSTPVGNSENVAKPLQCNALLYRVPPSKVKVWKTYVR